MKKILMVVFALVLAIGGVILFNKEQYVEIDEWSSSIERSKIEWAEISKGYGEESIRYSIPKEEYDSLVNLLKGVTEECSYRGENEDGERNDYALAFYYEDKLWLFQCQTDKSIQLTFEDRQTSEYYGCAEAPLYVDYPELWAYITDTINIKGK